MWNFLRCIFVMLLYRQILRLKYDSIKPTKRLTLIFPVRWVRLRDRPAFPITLVPNTALEWKTRQRCHWIKERLNPATMFVCSHFQGSKAETLYFYKLAAQSSRRTCLRASTTRRLWSRGARRRLCPPGCSHQALDRSNPRRRTSSVTSAAMQRTENRTLMSTTETYT